MERQPVTSSNIQSIGYAADSRTLEIEFNNVGVYQYFDVPDDVYQNLMKASSHGSYFHRHIRNRYRWEKVH